MPESGIPTPRSPISTRDPQPADPVRTIDAALLLNVTPNTLRLWEQQFAFPTSHASPGGHREFVFGEITALRDRLRAGHCISDAMTQARRACVGGRSGRWSPGGACRRAG